MYFTTREFKSSIILSFVFLTQKKLNLTEAKSRSLNGLNCVLFIPLMKRKLESNMTEFK